MNLWPAHGVMARAEAPIMSGVANHFISTKTSGPVNGQVQDSVMGCAELTRGGVVMDKFHAMGLYQNTGMSPPDFSAYDSKSRLTGREVVSLLFRGAPVNYSRAPTFFSEAYAKAGLTYAKDETRAVMERGTLLQGVLDNEAIGAKKRGSLFHIISRESGPQKALDYIYALQQVALQFLMSRGTTVGTAHMVVTAAALAEIHRIIAGVLLEAEEITERLQRGEIVPPIGMTVHQYYEKQQIEALRANDLELLRQIIGSINPRTNGLFNMVGYGSKGKNDNLIHIMAQVRQVLINDERIREQFSFRRTFPYFARFSTDPAAYGFIKNSYLAGLSTTEFFCSDMHGRFDLITKALSTSTTGYFMRKGVLANQSTVVDNYRRCTKDAQVVQYLYGEDGLDARQVERVAYRPAFMSDAALEKAFGGEQRPFTPEVEAAVAVIRRDRDKYREIFSRVEASNFGRPMVNEHLLPVNVARIVDGVFIARRAEGKKENKIDLGDLNQKIAKVKDLCDAFPYLLVNTTQEKRRRKLPMHISAATTLMVMVVRSELSLATLTKVTAEELTWIVDTIRQRFTRSLVDYGTAAGPLACQAVSEPLTQYMLDSHHRSVSGGTTKAGMVRVSEIYGAKPVEKEQSPEMLLPLKAEYAQDRALAEEIASSIEFVTLRAFVSEYDVLFESYAALTISDAKAARPLSQGIYPPFVGDAEWAREFERNRPLVRPPSDLTNWCYRFVLDKAAMVLKSISLEKIVERLRAKHPGAYIVHTPESVPRMVLRVYAQTSFLARVRSKAEPAQAEVLLDTPVRGTAGIMAAKVKKITRTAASADGSMAPVEEYAISTVGTNLYGAALNRYVDSTRIISNSVGDTMKMLGIDAARNKIITETRSFMEDKVPNLRHLMLYADEMTRTGRVTSVERGGVMQREPNNVMLNMAAGAPITVLKAAAFNCTASRVYGVAAPQLLGAIPQIGTLYNQLVVDEEYVKAHTVSLDRVLDELGA